MRIGSSFLLCSRIKLRGNSKVLITKDKTETSYLASLMTEGIVISLGILVIEMSDRGSKVVMLNNVTVKEQRVDGSLVIFSI